MQYSQEHLKTMVYAEFGGQTECIMGNSKIENDKFCEDGEFGKKLSKVWQKFTKRWQKGASWQMAIITNMAN